jgi:molybdenum cofactor guanylyltransferase
MLDQLTVLILAGGMGSRLGGQDKGLLNLGGQSLTERIIHAVSEQAQTVLISANRNLEYYRSLGVDVVSDRLVDYQGPLAGIEAGLAACKTPYMAILPCDAPFVDGKLLSELYFGFCEAQVDLAYAISPVEEGRWQAEPTFAVMRCHVLPSLGKYLDLGGRKILPWYHQLRYAEVRISDSQAFSNANTPEDLKNFQLKL